MSLGGHRPCNPEIVPKQCLQVIQLPTSCLRADLRLTSRSLIIILVIEGKWKSKQLKRIIVREQLETRYKLRKKGIGVVNEELKQRVVAKARRYEGTVD